MPPITFLVGGVPTNTIDSILKVLEESGTMPIATVQLKGTGAGSTFTFTFLAENATTALAALRKKGYTVHTYQELVPGDEGTSST